MLLALVAIVGLSRQQGAVAQRRFLRRLSQSFSPRKPAFRNCDKASLERLFDPQSPVTTKPGRISAAQNACSLGMAMDMCERCLGNTACIKARVQIGSRLLMSSTPECKSLLKLQMHEMYTHGYVPRGTFETCDELKTYGVREGGSSVQCSNMLVDPCCNECLEDQAEVRCLVCIDQNILDNFEAMVANQCTIDACENDRDCRKNEKSWRATYTNWIGTPHWLRSRVLNNHPSWHPWATMHWTTVFFNSVQALAQAFTQSVPSPQGPKMYQQQQDWTFCTLAQIKSKK